MLEIVAIFAEQPTVFRNIKLLDVLDIPRTLEERIIESYSAKELGYGKERK